jgi:hypothetical protein
MVGIFVAILTQRIPLTDGILRSLVSVAENQDDALRTICMQTLIEIGKLFHETGLICQDWWISIVYCKRTLSV